MKDVQSSCLEGAKGVLDKVKTSITTLLQEKVGSVDKSIPVGWDLKRAVLLSDQAAAQRLLKNEVGYPKLSPLSVEISGILDVIVREVQQELLVSSV